MDSISLTADGLMKTLYLAALLQVFHRVLESHIGFTGTVLKRGQIVCIVSQSQPNGFVDQLGNGTFRISRFETQRSMYLGVEVDGGTFGWITHT